MTPKQKVTKMLLFRIFLAMLIAAALIWCCLFVMKNNAMLNTLTAAAATASLFCYLVFKLRILQILFDRTREGTVIKVESITMVDRRYSRGASHGYRTEPGTKITVDYGTKHPKIYRVYADKIRIDIFRVGDRVKHFKGAKYPHNLTRKGEVFLCPFCARNLFEDSCPDCKIKF